MYPHLVDRCRIIQKLVRMERERCCNKRNRQKGLTQNALAQSSGVSQAAISKIENLERSVDNSKRRVSRDELLKVLTLGLKLEQEKIDAILWLFDGSVLTEDEIRGIRDHRPKAWPESYRDGELRGVVLDWLEELLARSKGPLKARPPLIIATGDEKANLAAVEELARVEGRPGQRMLEMRYPSFMSLPPCAYPMDSLDDGCSVEFRSLNDMRLLQIRLYGERSIHHQGCIEGYIEDGPEVLSRGQRKAQIQRWIELLESHEHSHYEVRLFREPVRLELDLKTTPPVLMGAMVNENIPWQQSSLKAQWIKVFDEHQTLSLLLQFERDWDRASEHHRTSSNAVEFLRYVLDKSP